MKAFNMLISALYPSKCAGCGEIISEGEYFCDYCFSKLGDTAKDKFCLKCGSSEKSCVCKHRVFSFDGCVSPYYRNTVATKAMYAYKFRHKVQFAGFFCEKMALCVKQKYYEIPFDFVTAVPLAARSERKRGYNQSEILGKGVAKILGIPYKSGLIKCSGKKAVQHKLSYKERFENINGAYYANARLKGGTVLLVDDIKTTGATLSECAKMLYTAGADKVYCVTGLVSDLKKKERT